MLIIGPRIIPADSTTSGVLDSAGFRNDQPESKKVHGSLGLYEEWKMERKFSPLEHYKSS
jgi:hypothetical protein